MSHIIFISKATLETSSEGRIRTCDTIIPRIIAVRTTRMIHFSCALPVRVSPDCHVPYHFVICKPSFSGSLGSASHNASSLSFGSGDALGSSSRFPGLSELPRYICKLVCFFVFAFDDVRIYYVRAFIISKKLRTVF